jgi:hypothetical protein
MGSYVKTAAANDTTALLLKKMDEVIAAMGSSDVVAKFNTLQAAFAAVISKLNAETALTQGPYVDGTSDAAVVAAPSTAASELM